MKQSREEIQQQAVQAYLSGNPKTCFNISVRTGKTKVGIDCMRELSIKKALILYPNLDIRAGWESDFEKFGYKPEDVTFSTFISMGKLPLEKWEFIIVDEPQKLSAAQLKVLELLVRFNPRILCLSGTYSEETKQSLREIGLEISYEYTTEQAVEDEIVADYKVNVVLYDLDSTTQYLKKTKNKQWYTTERKESDYLSKKVAQAVFDGRDVKFAALNRMRWINKTESLRMKALTLMCALERYIVYGTDTEFIESLHINTYHSKNKEEHNLERFIAGHINALGLINMASAGVTFHNLSDVVITNINSNSEDLMQKLGRSLLNDNGKQSTVWIICSTEDYQQKWLNKALIDIPAERINYMK